MRGRETGRDLKNGETIRQREREVDKRRDEWREKASRRQGGEEEDKWRNRGRRKSFIEREREV